MYNGKTISLKKILWKVMRNPLAVDLMYEDAAMYAIEAIELIGAPLSYINKITEPPITINDYKAALPEDLVKIRGVKLLGGGNIEHDIALTHTTDIYSTTDQCDDPTLHNMEEYTYQIQNGVINTSFDEGVIVISYKGLPMDDDGYPLIPDDIKTKMAMEYYILYRFLEPLYDIGKITDKAFQRIDQNKCWYMGAAQTSLQLQGMDHLESTMNAINRLIINDQAHKNFYKGMGKKEHIKRYN